MAKVILQDLTIYNCGSHEQFSDLKINIIFFCIIFKLTCLCATFFILALQKADKKTGSLQDNIIFIEVIYPLDSKYLHARQLALPRRG